MKRTIALLSSLLLLFVFAACDDEAADDEADDNGDEALEQEDSDDDDEAAESAAAFGQLGVIVESQTGDMISIEQSSDHQIEFCYEGDGCEGEAGSLGHTASVGGEGNTMVLDASDDDRSAVGARVAFEVEGDGEAVVSIGEGTLHVDDEGVVPSEEFDFDEVLETTDTLVDGDAVSIEIGEVD